MFATINSAHLPVALTIAVITVIVVILYKIGYGFMGRSRYCISATVGGEHIVDPRSSLRQGGGRTFY